jgi:hypothetical protein
MIRTECEQNPNTTYLLFLNTGVTRARTRRNDHIRKGFFVGPVHDRDWDDVVE